MNLPDFAVMVGKELISDMRRLLMKRSLTSSMSDKDRDVVECFLVDYEHERGLRT